MTRRLSAAFLTAATLIFAGWFAGPNLVSAGLAVGDPASDFDPPPQRGGGPGGAVASAGGDQKLTPVTITNGKAILTPDNTSIGFVGTHTGANPNPRLGGFAQFSGIAEVDTASNTLRSATVDIKTGSLWTTIPPLTEHLKSPDFFNANKFPAAKFVTKSIAPIADKPGEFTMTGELTLLGRTKDVSFPVKIELTGDGLTLAGKFTLDRTRFGMDHIQEKVEKGVTVTLAIGKKTQPQTGGAPGFGPRRPGGRGQPKANRPASDQ